MADIYHYFGDDLTSSQTGDLLLVDGTELGTQRIIRRLSTNQAGYIFQIEYGAGLPARVGEKYDGPLLEAIISSQIFLEPSVEQTPPPTITVSSFLNGVETEINYINSSDGAQTSLGFETTGGTNA